MSVDPLVHATIAGALALLFCSSAVHRLLMRSQWPDLVRNYRLLPAWLVAPTALAIGVSEAAAGLALAWTPTRATGAALAAALLATFAAAMAINIRRGRTHIDCGCVGARRGGALASWMVWRNVALATCALALFLPAGARTRAPWEAAMVAVWVATLALLYLAWQQLQGVRGAGGSGVMPSPAAAAARR